MMRLFTILSIAVILGAGVFLVNLWIFIDTPSSRAEIAQTIVVDRGEHLSHIVDELYEKGVIGNIPLFKAYVVLRSAESKVRAGEYIFPPHATPSEVLDLLMKGEFATKKVTIPEGWTMKEIAGLLGSLKLADPDRFLLKCSDTEFIRSLGIASSTLEGYLFPDTYEIFKPKNEEEVLKKFVDHFKDVYAKQFEQRAKEVGMSEADVMTLASIVEKETGSKSERPLIAGVFLNRLKIGMPLATDPTIIYGIPNFNGNLTKQNLTTPGPYNTYLNVGLPPTPISNPGAASIRAVLYPTPSDYLYFVSKNDGTHYFSKTKEEHEEAVKKYQISRMRTPTPETTPNGY